MGSSAMSAQGRKIGNPRQLNRMIKQQYLLRFQGYILIDIGLGLFNISIAIICKMV
jgi:hypothetical protein